MPSVLIQTASGERTQAYQVWNGQSLRSTRSCPAAFDVETEMIGDRRHIPRLALATASDGKTHVVIHPDRLGDFLVAHKDASFVGHNVQFDFWVVDQHLQQAGERGGRRVLWEACENGRLLDTLILDLLLQLATGNFRKVANPKKGKNDDTKVYPGSLAEVAADYTILRVNKEDPYRTRFGELIGHSETDWAGVDPGFFEYAVRDAVVTRRLYPALANAAYELMQKYGFDAKATRYDIRPDAVEKFGHLSEVIQVQASVVLAHLLRRGVRVDLDTARKLEDKYRSELSELIASMERDYKDVLTYDKAGTLKLTPTSQTPSLGPKKLVPMLLKTVEQINTQGHELKAPTGGKKKGVSCSVKAWAEYATLHPFLRLWGRMTKLTKLLGFLARFRAPVLHGEYSLLMRTGRTSCSAPRSEELPGLNLQQIPKESEFRSLFLADPGKKLFTGDFSTAELRTLAAVCKARYGHSQLGDVIVQGTDPHAFTAAAIQGLTLEAFMNLKKDDPGRFKAARQAAKAVNFGVPGGLGVNTLVAYAKANYGVTLTPEEAAAFKTRLVTEVYPELNPDDGYLADRGMAALAHNLGVKEREAWEALDRRGEKHPAAVRGAAKVVRGQSTASEWYQESVWDGLCRLARTSRGLDPDLAGMIARREGGAGLHARLYHQSVATLTGRIRAGVGYTDGKNTPFQSLAADGGKLALWKLLFAGFDVAAFVHDEILVQLNVDTAKEDAGRVQKIMEAAMEEVMGHGVPADCEWVTADCWTKP